MARGINKVILVGSCGQDPEVKYTPTGSAVVNLSVATSEQWNDKATGQKVEKTEWHRVVLFGKLAEIAGEYVTKGQLLYIEGRLQTREWEKDGIKRYTTEIVGDTMQMLGGRKEAGGEARSSSAGQGAPARATPQASPAPTPAAQPAPEYDNFDDDIPF